MGTGRLFRSEETARLVIAARKYTSMSVAKQAGNSQITDPECGAATQLLCVQATDQFLCFGTISFHVCQLAQFANCRLCIRMLERQYGDADCAPAESGETCEAFRDSNSALSSSVRVEFVDAHFRLATEPAAREQAARAISEYTSRTAENEIEGGKAPVRLPDVARRACR
jgi:hypothetical protein